MNCKGQLTTYPPRIAWVPRPFQGWGTDDTGVRLSHGCATVRDPVLGRCLALIMDKPKNAPITLDYAPRTGYLINVNWSYVIISSVAATALAWLGYAWATFSPGDYATVENGMITSTAGWFVGGRRLVAAVPGRDAVRGYGGQRPCVSRSGIAGDVGPPGT